MASIAEILLGQSAQTNQNLKTDNPGLQGFVQGASLAIEQEKLQVQKAQFEKAKQDAQLAKYDKLGDLFVAASKMPNGAAKKAFTGEYIPSAISALGLQDQINPISLKMLQGDPNLAAYLKDQLQKGDMNFSQVLGALQDPETLSKVVPGATQFGDAEKLKTTIEGNIDELSDAAKFAQSEEGKSARASNLARATESRFQRGQEFTNEQNYTSFVKSVQDDVKAGFQKNNEAKLAVRNAYSGLEQVTKDIAAGKKPSSIDFNSAARGLAKAFNSGAMTDDDVNDFKRTSGLADLTEDTINKWLTGNINQKSVATLKRLAIRTATNLDNAAATEAQRISPSFTVPQFADRAGMIRQQSGIDAYLTPTLKLKAEKPKAGQPVAPQGGAAPKTAPTPVLDEVKLNMLKQVIQQFPGQKAETLKRMGITEQQYNDLIKGGK